MKTSVKRAEVRIFQIIADSNKEESASGRISLSSIPGVSYDDDAGTLSLNNASIATYSTGSTFSGILFFHNQTAMLIWSLPAIILSEIIVICMQVLLLIVQMLHLPENQIE